VLRISGMFVEIRNKGMTYGRQVVAKEGTWDGYVYDIDRKGKKVERLRG